MTMKSRARASALLLALLPAGLTAASQQSRPKEDRWLEVRSPHFVVVSNAGENSARRAAGDFERIRAVFLKALEDDRDEFEPVVVLAVKDEEGLKELLPEYWEREGSRPTASSSEASTNTSSWCDWMDVPRRATSSSTTNTSIY